MTDIEFCPVCNNIICDCPSILSNHIIEGSGQPLQPIELDRINPSKNTICEICNTINDKGWFKHSGMYMCPSCRDKEMALSAKNAAGATKRVSDMKLEHASKTNQETVSERKEIYKIAEEIPVEGEIQVRTDIFNAKTISIIELKKNIDDDDSIVKKHFALASQLKNKFLHLRKILFDIDEARVSITSEQRSIQTYLNELANRLRTDERDLLKLADMSYKPVAPKLVKNQTPKIKKPKFDKVELKRLSAEIGVPEFTLQTICVAKNIQPAEAAKLLKGLQE